MGEFSTRQYAQSAVEVAVVAVKEAGHLTKCFGQLAVMYAHEKLNEWDDRQLQRTDLGDSDGNA